MQSEPVPEGWDERPVKELVGMNLEEVVFNPSRTVFVLFCMFCLNGAMGRIRCTVDISHFT